jgi:ribosomal protein S18 acetylase RimI-like enzyme
MSRLPDEHMSHATSEGTVSLLRWRQSRRKALAVVSRAFAGTASTTPEAGLNWCMGPTLATLDDPARNAAARFAMTLGLCSKGPNSTMIASQDGAGNILAIGFLQKLARAPPQYTLMETIRVLGTLVSMAVRRRIPRSANAPGFQKRGDVVTRQMSLVHKASADFPHLYLVLLATDPPHHGKGHGAALLRALSRVADPARLPVYLETGANNRGLYEHFGYEVVQETTLDLPATKGPRRVHPRAPTSGGPSSWPSCPYLGMLRQPRP